jgi:cephalosporin hydroxylase
LTNHNGMNEELEVFKNKYLDWFHKNCVFNNKWGGRQAQKTPFDAWIFQEIICDTQPDIIIEIGNYAGGSTLYLANVLDSLAHGRILAIDIDHSRIQNLHHKRIKWITGNAISNEIIQKVNDEIGINDKVMVIEDSSHTYANTLSILEIYSRIVSVGCYFIIEDGICKEDFIGGPKPGPYEAIHVFLKEHEEFEIDKNREKFLLTYNPDGYLKKLK